MLAATHQVYTKFQKSHTFIDDADAYHTSMILDPRHKGRIQSHSFPGQAGQTLVKNVHENIRKRYYKEQEIEQLRNSHPNLLHHHADLQTKVVKRLTALQSGIDDYFESPRVRIDRVTARNPNWLFEWWNTHAQEMPQMAAAARDYLSIPTTRIAAERLFEQAAETRITVTQNPMYNADLMRMMMLLEARE